jgi:hypothetical protein
MKKHLGIIAGTILVCVTILFASQTRSQAAFGGGSSQPPIGKNCIVQFRRGDALGSGANLPVAPLTGSINGAETSIAGALRNVTEEWLVIEANGANIWIPKSAILLVQMGN